MFEGMFIRALKPRGPFLEELKAAGFDPSALAPDYPGELFSQCLEIARKYEYPQSASKVAEHELGRRFAQGFLGTLLGRFIRAAMPMFKPAQMIDKIPGYIAMGGAVAVTCQLKEERSRQFSFEDASVNADFMAGLLEGGLRDAAAQYTVHVLHEGPHAFALRVSW